MPEMARVIGRLWATSKYDDLESATLQVLEPLTCELRPAGAPFIAVDTVGAGPGELVFYVTAYEAVIPFHRDLVPIDAAIVGIVDEVASAAPPAPKPKKKSKARKSKNKKKKSKK